MDDAYYSIAGSSQGMYKEKGSKFLSFTHPVETHEQIKQLLEYYDKQYYDARHICYAYRLGAKGLDFRANDNGEPSATAGKPILGQILSAELSDILIVVVRYFGGTKLGTSGLITAYKSAALSAIEAATKIEKLLYTYLNCRLEYPFLDQMMRIVKEESPEIIYQNFDNDCTFQLRIRESESQRLIAKMSKVTSLVWLDPTE